MKELYYKIVYAVTIPKGGKRLGRGLKASPLNDNSSP